MPDKTNGKRNSGQSRKNSRKSGVKARDNTKKWCSLHKTTPSHNDADCYCYAGEAGGVAPAGGWRSVLLLPSALTPLFPRTTKTIWPSTSTTTATTRPTVLGRRFNYEYHAARAPLIGIAGTSIYHCLGSPSSHHYITPLELSWHRPGCS